MTITPIYSDSIEHFLDLIENTRYDDLPEDAVTAAKVFFLDTTGVACAGHLAPKMDAMLRAATQWDGGSSGAGQGVTVWNTGQRTSAPVAALLNGYQCHALEYDCVYEPGVVLPTPPIFSALMLQAERLANAGHPPSGKDLLKAFVVALEVSCTLGLASKSAMFFFRPSTTGVFSALAAMACLSPLPREQLRYAFGIAYSQMCGTMQAHEEGSMMLAMQMGFAARNAVQAYDLALLGITAPVNILDGRFGFFRNFETDNTLPHALAQMCKPWKVTQLSHKPFPSGRVTHGSLYSLRLLQAELGLRRETIAQDIKRITVQLPPLGMRLVGRPIISNPPPNYARLCVPYVAACELLFGNVDPSSFLPDKLGNFEIESLAKRVVTIEVPHTNPNAFYPQHLTLEMVDGRIFERPIPHAWGHPLLPMSEQAREDKFRLCWHLARTADSSSEQAMEMTLRFLKGLEDSDDCVLLLAVLHNAP